MKWRRFLPGTAALVALLMLPPAARALPPAPAGCSTQTVDGTVGAVADALGGNPNIPSVTNFPVTVSGAGAYLFAADVTTGLAENQYDDVKVELLPPAPAPSALLTGNRVDSAGNVLNSNIPSRGANVLNGTVWDDDADVTANSATYTANTLTSPVTSQTFGLAGLRGANPNGQWTLKITDFRADASGGLSGWHIGLVTCPAAPANGITTANGGGAAVPAPGAVSSTVDVTTPQCYSDSVTLHTDITAPNGLDLDLLSPEGTTVHVSSGTAVNGRTWGSAQANQAQSLGRLRGEDPNGTWRLTVTDHSSATPVSLNSWSLVLGTDDCAPADVGIAFGAVPAATAGTPVTLGLTATNGGPATSSHTVVSVPVPAGTALVAATAGQGNCTGTTTVTCLLGRMAPGAAVPVNLSLTAAAAGQVPVTASISATQSDPQVGNNTAMATLPVAAPAAPPPSLTNLTVNPKRFRLGTKLPTIAAVKTGTKIRFTLSEAAPVEFSFTRRLAGRRAGTRCVAPSRARHGKRCTRSVPVRTRLSVSGKQGADVVSFYGRLTRKSKLAPGSYRVTAIATDAAGGSSIPASASFTLLPAVQRR